MNTEPSTKQYVSRGGLKLASAISNFEIRISDLTVLDVGSSTGGFVDCLLQNGAARVYSVDTAYGELAWKLRQDPRVVVMERTNILHLPSLPVIPTPSVIPTSPVISSNLTLSSRAKREISYLNSEISPPSALGGQGRNDNQKTEPPKASPAEGGTIEQRETSSDQVDLITIDASWTKLELILPIVQKFLKPDGQIVALLKPHYQADKKLLVKGVLPPEYLEQIKKDVSLKISNLKFQIIGELVSPILGGGGNQEFLLLIKAI